ncbi:beta-L-arabinofuranosidase domain-containing protein [Allorhodopirellula solitaria]|uniref:Non-reducing end beta-L-arabinofuranosidase n=1 Tax=Allorhodopirellula solitaria TaxID=2527987 RepID=A0A5C5X005_9BACT|nr:beta-L-arabinofuranosidase domain-containing protein [Allorhodopirellula solitaria]TWT55493.1 Non-reducing end beta-L-arabinofuranosidase [Allorhodopirellula solitaria]
MKPTVLNPHVTMNVFVMVVFASAGIANESDSCRFNRAPLIEKPYAELPLGAVKPEGWLKHQLEVMADGLTGNLDEAYEAVCGDRNAWLGGDGDAWERGPYWIDGLYPLAKLLDDEKLEAKAMRWIDWTLANQRPSGQIGPYEIKPEDRTAAPPAGAQFADPDDWWPRMVMMKILQQHYMATGDDRSLSCMLRYARFQLNELKSRPLYEANNPDSGSWWAGRRGGDNVMSVYWLYNVTGEDFLLELADLLVEQTYPWVDDFQSGKNMQLFRYSEHHSVGQAYHCVNLGHALKYPLVFGQRGGIEQSLAVTMKALHDIRRYHGQPHGLWGGDEGMHGTDPTRGSEFCTISETLFSLEKNFEIVGDVRFADMLERIAFNALPTQASDDFTARQYFQQANQISCTHSPHKFTNHPYESNLFGLLSGYPCCTCNMHQAWPKLTAHLWMASRDHGLATMAYAPCRVTTTVGETTDGEATEGETTEVTIVEETDYPFRDTVRFTLSTEEPVRFPLRLRIPHWCENASIEINGDPAPSPARGTMAVLERVWKTGDTVTLRLPMKVRFERGHENSVSVMRGPLVFALKMDEQWTAGSHGQEVRSETPWNFSLFEKDIVSGDETVASKFVLKDTGEPLSDNPWNVVNAPVSIEAFAVRNPLWGSYHDEAGPLPWSPAGFPKGEKPQRVRLIPYGCSTLRVSAFPTVN